MIKVMTAIVFLLTISLPIYAGMPLTVDEATNLALQNNESYLSAKEELIKAKNQVYEVRASAFPQLNAGVSYIRNWELPTMSIDFGDEQQELKMGTDHSWTSELTLTQPLYNGGSVFAAWGIAKLYRKYSEFLLESQKRELKLRVIESYYSVVMTNELERVAAQAVELAEDNLDIVKKMNVQGLISDYEVLMAEVRLANLKPALIKAKSDTKITKQALNSLIGLDLNEQVDVIWHMDSTEYFIPEYDLDSLKHYAVENRPELNMIDLEAKMRKKNITVASAGYRPKLNFLTTLQYQAQFDDNKWPGRSDWIRSYYSGITLDIPIFDSWRTPSKVKQAKIEYKQAQLNKQELEDNLTLDIEQSWWNYQAARENFATQGQSVEMARRGLDIARVRFQNGVSTQLELFEAEVALSTAENYRIIAFYDLVVGYASLMKAIGEDRLLR